MDLGVVFFTNERTYDLTSLTVPYYLKNSKELSYPVTVLSNRLPVEIEKIPGVNYFSADIPYCSVGTHFSPILRKFLTEFPYEYILFFCDDYLVKSPIKTQIFNQLLVDIQELDISKLHLGTLRHLEYKLGTWNKNVKENYTLIELDKNYRHTLSVQPSIWKTEHLLNILLHNPDLSLHGLDNSNVRDENGTYRPLEENQEFYIDSKFKHYDHRYFGIHSGVSSYHVDERSMNSDYLVLDYIEFIRHGKILEPNVNSKKHILDILEKDNLTKQFKHYF